MPWDRSQPTDPKYRSREHRAERAKYVRQMKQQGYLVCAQPVCVMPSRIIKPGDRWHVGHDDAGTTYIGPVCAKCNVTDAGRRANRRSRGLSDTDQPARWNL